MLDKLALTTKRTFLVSYALFNIFCFGKITSNKNLSEHLKIFYHAQQIQDFNKALGNAGSYIKKIKYIDDLENYGVDNYYASLKVINGRMKDDCDGKAVVGMALLNKFKPKMLIIGLDSLYTQAHAECFVEIDNKFYAPGVNDNKGVISLKGLIEAISSQFENKYNWKYYKIGKFKLEDLLNADGDIKDKMIVLDEGNIEN